MKTRKQVQAVLAKHYSNKFNGKVWCLYDENKRMYCIRGEKLLPTKELQNIYPNGWSLLDYIKPAKAQSIASNAERKQ